MKIIRTKKGITLIEVAAGLAILAMSMLFFSRMMADSSASTQAAADAKKLNMMAKAAQTYINVEKADLEAFLTSPTQVAAIPLARNSEGQLPPDGPHTTLPSVQKAGLLAAEFIDMNALGQRHALLVREPAAGKLEGLVVAYSGNGMPDVQLGKVVQSLGIAGGGVFAKDVIAGNVAVSNINGYAGGWSTPASAWMTATVNGVSAAPSAGRPVVSISMMDVVGGTEETDKAASPTAGTSKISRKYGIIFSPPSGFGYQDFPEVVYCPMIPHQYSSSIGTYQGNRVLRLEFAGISQIFSNIYFYIEYHPTIYSPYNASMPIINFRFSQPSSPLPSHDGIAAYSHDPNNVPNCMVRNSNGTYTNNATLKQLCDAGLCEF